MSLGSFSAVGYELTFVAYLFLCIQLTQRSIPGVLPRAIWIAGVATVLWSLTEALHGLGFLRSDILLSSAYWTRNLGWLIVIVLTIRELSGAHPGQLLSRKSLLSSAFIVVATIACIGLVYAAVFAGGDKSLFDLAVATLAIGLCELAFRSAVAEHRQTSRYIAIAVGGIFIFEFFANLPVSFLREIEPGLDVARGFVSVIFFVPLFLATRHPLRLADTEPEPQRVVYYLFSIAALAVLMLTLLIVDYYIGTLQGTWQTAMWIGLFAGLVCTVGVLSVSPRLRGQIRVFLTKSFLPYKYDYRKEWLRFISTMSEAPLSGELFATSIRAVARIVNSPGGVVWLLDRDNNRYVAMGEWQMERSGDKAIDADAGLVRFIEERQWVIDLTEMKRHPSRYGDLEIDAWLVEGECWWIIVPLLLRNDLYGFIALTKPPGISKLNFEDHDLLRTVGRHVATYLKQAESDKQLSEAQQFSTYHRLSAFLMHDLNNLAAQQALVVKNAERHKNDPKFFDDAIATIANSVSRMNRLLEQLSRASDQPTFRDIDLRRALSSAVQRNSQRDPRPQLNVEEEGLRVSADFDRLSGVFEHLIKNAQEATNENGNVAITLTRREDEAKVTIEDDGCGMSEDFISQRLFKPFDSTKGSQSMGIGAYQAREYIRMVGGKLEVFSSPDQGTTFILRLPLARSGAAN